MIYTERKVTVSNNSSSQSAPIIIYRGDREIEILFTIVDSKYKFSSEKGNYIIDTGAKYAQLAIDNPNGVDIFTDVTECIDGAVIFKITADMIDEINEVGSYSYHIRLYDDTKDSRITIPPVRYGIEIREPIVIESIIDDDEVDDSTVDSNEESFIGEDGKLTIEWERGDIISSVKLNQMVEVINNAVDEEQQRKTNEATRVSNEQKRQKDTTDRLNAMDAKIDSVEPYIDTLVGNVISNDLVGYEDVSGSNFSEPTFDGYMKNIEVHGNSLVNLWGNKSSDFRKSGQITFNEDIQFAEIETTENRFSNLYTSNVSMYKPNTLYTMIVHVVENTFPPDLHAIKISTTEDNPSNVVFGKSIINISGGAVGIFVYTVTSINDISTAKMALRTYIDNSQLVAGLRAKFRIIILEGDHTQNPPEYFEGLGSVGDKIDDKEIYKIDILSNGKNLFNGEFKGFTTPGISSFGNTNISKELGKVTFNATSGSFSFKCYLKQGVEYILSFDVSNITPNYMLSINSVRTDYGSAESKKRITRSFISQGENEIIVGVYNTFVGSSTLSNFQIEESNVATPYQPYQEDRLTILSPVELNKVDDVVDRIICKDGVWGVEKNIITRIFNGSESNLQFVRNDTQTSVFLYRLADAIDYSDIICDKFLARGFETFMDGIEDIKITDDYLYVNILNSKLSRQTLEGVKEWLSKNPLTIKYQTTQPQFIPLPLDQQLKLRTFAGKTYFDVQTAVPGTLVGKVPTSVHASVGTQSEQIDILYDELDKVKKLEEVESLSIKTDKPFTTIQDTTNGYLEFNKIEGKTLANIVDYNSYSFLNSSKSADNIFTLQFGANENTSNIRPVRGTHNYKPNTIYTLIVYIIENTADAFLGISDINTPIIKYSDKQFWTKLGYSAVTIEIGDSLNFSNDLYFCSWTKGGDLSKSIKFKYMILEGDHTQNPPEYFEGLKSVGQDEGTTITTTNAPMFFGKGGRK